MLSDILCAVQTLSPSMLVHRERPYLRPIYEIKNNPSLNFGSIQYEYSGNFWEQDTLQAIHIKLMFPVSESVPLWAYYGRRHSPPWDVPLCSWEFDSSGARQLSAYHWCFFGASHLVSQSSAYRAVWLPAHHPRWNTAPQGIVNFAAMQIE
jgi:hypothetical protein